jgi:hypothetical protein
MRRRIHVYVNLSTLTCEALYISIHVCVRYEEEDTCMCKDIFTYTHVYVTSLGYMSHEEEDTCHMRRRIHVRAASTLIYMYM